MYLVPSKGLCWKSYIIDPNILSIRKLKTITFSFLYVLVKSFNTLVRVRSLKSLSNVSPKPTTSVFGGGIISLGTKE